MAYLERKTVHVPEAGIPETTIIAVSNGWVIYAGRPDRDSGGTFDRVIAAFESFETLSGWLKSHIEDNTKQK